MADSVPLLEVAEGDALLKRHFPRYFFDKDEEFSPADLNAYIANKAEVPGCNGVAVKSKDGLTWLVYMNYYLEDGGLRVCGCAGCTAGEHAYDLEVVVVELGSEGAVTGVFFGPHSSFEHFWVRDAGDLEALMGGDGGDGYRPRVFISRGKHASYPIEGTVFRLFGFGNDACNDPIEKNIPFVILEEAAIDTEFIDNVFRGPKDKITRDWSVAEAVRVESVSNRLLIPPFAQISQELGDLNRSVCCSGSCCSVDEN